MILGIDHIALGVRDLDARIAFFTDGMAMKLKRKGTQYSTGARIAFLTDSRDFKIELIEAPSDEPAMLHVAYRVDDVDAEYNTLLAKGCASVQPPHEIRAAKARTALVKDSSGLQIQIINYAPDSPDL